MENLHEVWPHRWITPKAKSYKSPIHGFGVIAMEPINKGEVVMFVGGIAVPRAEILKYRAVMWNIGIQVHDDFWIVPTTRKELEETGVPNHSCDPNIGFEGSVCYIEIRDVSPEEEIVVDYAFMESEFEPFKCKCGSQNCRKTIKPDDWKIPELQKKYGQYFSPYLKKQVLK